MANEVLLPVAGALMGGLIAKQASADYWYDVYHGYHAIDEQYTRTVDNLLLNPNFGYIKSWKIVDNTWVPGEGVHYYSLAGFVKDADDWWTRRYKNIWWMFYYIGLIKVIKQINNRMSEFYLVFLPPGMWCTFRMNFCPLLFVGDANSIRVMHIDTSDHLPKIIVRDEVYRGGAHANQIAAVGAIVARYNNDNVGHNVKVMLTGGRGLGKTYVSKIVKRVIDGQAGGHCCKLFSNFDPTHVGVDIVTLALQGANDRAPVILVMNEAPAIFADVYADKNGFDPRSQHTKNPATFHNMLDAIDATRHTIAIFTSEISAQELYRNDRYKSFMRQGRIDMFIHLTENDAQPLDPAVVRAGENADEN